MLYHYSYYTSFNVIIRVIVIFLANSQDLNLKFIFNLSIVLIILHSYINTILQVFYYLIILIHRKLLVILIGFLVTIIIVWIDGFVFEFT